MTRTIKFIEKKDVEKILGSIKFKRDNDRRDHALITVLFSTGMRIHEALALDADEMRLLVEEKGTSEFPIIGKGGKQRVVFFSRSTKDAIAKHLEKRKHDSELLFPISPRQAQRAIKKRAEWVGLGAWITPHKLRHSFATHVLRAGGNMRVVQELLGHSSIATTQIYAGVTNRDLLEQHRKVYD